MKKSRKVICIVLVCAILIGSLTNCAIPVLALSAGGLKTTIASVILSLMMQAGIAPTNTTWITQLNNAYGVESSIGTLENAIESGLLTQTSTGLVDTGLSSAIESASAYQDLGLAEIFTTTADDVGVAVASGGTNLANTAINCGTLGTIGAFAGATAVGVGIGVLARKLNEKYMDRVINGLSEDALINPNLANYKYKFYCTYKESGANRFITINAGSNEPLDMCYRRGNIYLINKSTGDVVCPLSRNWKDSWYDMGTGRVRSQTYYIYAGGGVATTGDYRGNGVKFSTPEECEAYCNAVLSGEVTPTKPVSPDLIGPLGNLKYDDDTDSIPGLENQVPNGYDMYPVNMDTYMQAVNGANQNTENGEEALNGDVFNDLIDPLLVEPSIIPDQGVTVPDYGNRDIVPDQPVLPSKPDVTPEQEVAVLGGATTPQLRDIFPFCIPFDLYAILKVLSTEDREAPHITWTFPFNDEWTIDVDLAVFDEVAALLRTLELLVFIVGLAIMTRYLVGAS